MKSLQPGVIYITGDIKAYGGLWQGGNKMCVFGAHTSVHNTRRAHNAHINYLGKRPYNIALSTVLDQ